MLRLFLLIPLLLIISIPLYAFQTIRVAAIRVEFQPDDNTLTTGDGTFLMDSTSGIDPAPHNRTYFKDQIIAADNYFNTVSEGRVRISGDVFPKGLNNSYVLSNEMNYYNPNTTQAEIDKGIANLFIDAVQLADSDPDWNYSDYDLVVIFHAGVGRDIDLGFDETPQDISSLFVNQQFVRKNLDQSFTGVPVDNGSHNVEEGIILPETESQQEIQIALTGMFVSNIGSYLGLYDLFSAEEQRSGVGQFGLMDAGLVNFNGLIPAPPSAFHRKMLKWDIPLVLDGPVSNQRIANKYSNTNTTDPKLIEIPINEDEYYLIEYRGLKKENVDSLIFELSEERDSLATYLDLLKEYFPGRINISDSSGVLLSVDNYDFGIPGVGILIWHIDESVIRDRQDRIINNDPAHRAVDLEEADGSQDIGEQYNILQTGSELGWLFDFWHANNDAPLYEENGNEFSSNTIPNTRSNLNRAETGITINNFSSYNNDFMTFNYSRDHYESGFPVNLKSNATSTYSISGIPAGKQQEYIFTVNDSGDVFAMGADGKGLFYDDKFLIGQVANSTGSVLSLALADTTFNGDGLSDVLLVLSNGSLYNFDLSSSDIDSLAQVNFSIAGITEAAKSPLVISHNQMFFVDGQFIRSYYISDTLSVLQSYPSDYLNDLLIEDNIPFTPTYNVDYIARINGSQIISATLQNQETEFNIYNSLNSQIESSFYTDSIVGQFALGDVDDNGTIDIIYNSKSQLFVSNLNGKNVVNFPVSPILAEGEYLIGTPLVVDFSGQGDVILMVSTNKGQITAFNMDGKIVEGFPFSAGGEFSSSALVLQMDDDSALELATVSNSGNVSVWEIPGSDLNSKVIWGSANLNNKNNSIFQETYTVQQVGKGLIPKARFFNYPNPNDGDFTTIRYYLNEEADVTIRIFDTSGYKVDEFSGPGSANTTNEKVWNVSNFSSGVYVCQLEASSDNYSERKIIKIMVIH